MIPAINLPPSEKLTKLKLFLEKTKTEFVSENSDLIEWMKDRKLKIEDLSFSQEKLSDQEKFETNSVETQLLQKLASSDTNDPLTSSITQEEYDSIVEKMIALLKLPAGQLEEESELYLEQQLSDILGIDLAVSLENQKLLFSTGIMKAVAHLKRSPTDSLEQHTNHHEAEISKNRSAFGWFSSSSNFDLETIEKEKYFITLPLYFHPEWSKDYDLIKKWYKFRKVVVINPHEHIAVVCSVADIGPSTYTRRQFGGSPELIRTGKIWSPKSAGRVLVLFVEDLENTVPYGPIYFDKFIRK